MLKSISPQELAELLKTQPQLDLLDVRTPLEFQEVHCCSARNIPLQQLDPQSVLSQRKNPTEPLYLICRSGGRGQQACEKFCAAGFTNVINVEGGTSAWVAAGLPVQRGKKVMSLERQVRIVAGTLIVLGGVLALVVHPTFAVLSAFVGAGLVFAGLTDSCAMGMAMARMPWNNQASASCANPTFTEGQV